MHSMTVSMRHHWKQESTVLPCNKHEFQSLKIPPKSRNTTSVCPLRNWAVKRWRPESGKLAEIEKKMARPAQTILYLLHALSQRCGTSTKNADKSPAFNQDLRWHNWEVLPK